MIALLKFLAMMGALLHTFCLLVLAMTSAVVSEKCLHMDSCHLGDDLKTLVPPIAGVRGETGERGDLGPQGETGDFGDECMDLRKKYFVLENQMEHMEAVMRKLLVAAGESPIGYQIRRTPDRKTYQEAQKWCGYLGGALVHKAMDPKLDGKYEEDIRSIFNGSGMWVKHWIGLDDIEEEGQWKFLDGRLVDKTTAMFGWAGPWYDLSWDIYKPLFEPNGGREENCATLEQYWEGEEIGVSMFDRVCETALFAICEVPVFEW